MTGFRARWAGLRDRRWKDGGYVAVMTAFLMMSLMGLTAFAVDVGNWYLVGQQEQRAADAAVMAGVTYLPADSATAFTTAQNYSKINGFQHGVAATTVTAGLDGRPTRLRVTVARTVNNFFGSLLGLPTTQVGRTAVADFAGPVPMGSPCNRFGNNPDPGTTEATACSGVLGGFWASVNSFNSTKANGDAYQGNVCATTTDGCSGSSSGPNIDYATDGYYYTVSVKAAMSSMTIELFDPAWVNTGLTCANSSLFDDNGDRAWEARNPVVSDESTRYNYGSSSVYCNGDAIFGGSLKMSTEFTVRDPGTSPWDVSTFPVHAGCQTTYPGYTGKLFDVLDQSDGNNYDTVIVNSFRRWSTLCTIANPVVGDYLIQVKSKVGANATTANATNHFAIRATGSASGDKENLAVAGREKMGIYANKPGVTTEFHLARVPTSAAGQTLKVRLFDVGDTASGGSTGTINIIKPPDAGGSAFTGCVGVLSTNAPVTLSTCSLTGVQSSTHNGKWQSISVPIPANYTCTDADTTKCWVRLQYVYGSSTAPNDVTSWTAIIEGDPVRLVE